LASPLTFKTNKTMAIKKTTAVKKSDPPKKKPGQAPDAPRAEMFMRAGKYFAQIPPAGKKDDTNYYTFEKGGRFGGYKTPSKPKPAPEVYAGGTKNPIFDPAKVRGMGRDAKGNIIPAWMMQEQAAAKAAKAKQKEKLKATQIIKGTYGKTAAPAKKKK